MNQYIILIINRKMRRELHAQIRPQSAKYGYKGIGRLEMAINDKKQFFRKKVKMIQPELTTHEFARLMPQKIQQDKERLYSQAFNLKQSLNETLDENMKLKTKIAILQKENQKLNKFLNSSEFGPNSRTQSRLNIYSNKPEKQSLMIRNLKKIIRESKEQKQILKLQMAKLKKVIKFTKINELQIEVKMLLQENQRVNTLVQELVGRVNGQQNYQQKFQQLQSQLQKQMQTNSQLRQANQNYNEYLRDLEEKFKQFQEKSIEKEKKLQKQLGLTRKKLTDQTKISQELRKQIHDIKNSEVPKKNIKGIKFNYSSNPHQKDKPKQPNDDLKQEYISLKQKNQKLVKQLQQMSVKFQQSQNNLKKIRAQNNEIVKKNKLKNQQVRENKQLILQTPQKKLQIKKENPLTQIQVVNNENKEVEYSDEFETPVEIVSEKKVKDQQNNEIEEYKKDFNEQDQIQEQLYTKKVQKKKKNQQQIKIVHKKTKKSYKNNKEELKQIKELLTYRMKAQRYPFYQLKKDIQSSDEKAFKFLDLENMLKDQPFYLTPKYIQIVLSYIFENQNPKNNDETTSQNFIEKLSKLIGSFTNMEQADEEESLLRIAQMTTTYPAELEAAFQKDKNGEGTISKAELINMFKKLQLSQEYIELIISQLSLCSQDIDHLNFYGFFERFYINQEEKQQNLPIYEQQVQSSVGSSAKHLKNQSKGQSKKNSNSNKFQSNRQSNQLTKKENQDEQEDQQIIQESVN